MSFNCLDQKTNIWGPHFLEASAGTGKTFSIEHVVARLLIEKEDQDALDLENILVVTFTKAAARELRARIRQNLEALLEQMEDGSSSSYAQGVVNKESCIQRVQSALYNFDKAQIFTIHGFCQRMLVEFSIEAGIQVKNSDIDQFEGKKIIKDVIRDFFKYEVSSEEFGTSQISILLNTYRDVEQLFEDIFKNISDECSAGASFSHLYESCRVKVEQFPAFAGDLVRQNFTLLFPEFKKSYKWTEEALYGQLELVLGFLSEPSLEKFDRLVQSKLTLLDFLSAPNQKVRSKLSDEEKSQALEFFERVRSEFYPIIQEASSAKQIFSNLCSKAQKIVQNALELHGLLPPDELLKKMNSSLNLPGFLQAVQKKYRAVIIDEFQDTDPLQWSVFEKISKGKIDAFYLVGDPKQSIYAFRKADLYTYFKAAEFLGNSHHYYLDTNYRSTPSLIDSLNALFSEPISFPWFHLPKLQKVLPYRKVEAGKTSSNSKGPSLRFFSADGESGRSKWPSPSVEQTKLFPFIAHELHQWVEQGKSLKDCAVLVKDRYQAQSLRQFLLQHRIASRLISRGSIGQSPAFFAIHDLFQALYHPRNAKLIKIALKTPLLGWSFSEIQQLGDSIPDWIYAQFYYLKRVLEEEGISGFFSQFLETRWKLTSMNVKQHLLSLSDLSFYQQFIQLMEHLLELDHQKNLTKDQLFETLASLKVSDPEEDEQSRLRMDVDDDSLQIMTSHMSKGLEFEVVFALGVCCRAPYDADETLDALNERNAEKLREFYVAMTRAKEILYVPLLWDRKKPANILARASSLELFLAHMKNPVVSEAALQDLSGKEILEHLKPLIESKLISVVECQGSFSEQLQAKDAPLLNEPKKLSLELPSGYIQSFTQLREQEESKVKLYKEKQIPEGISLHSMPAGAEVGVILHSIFEEILNFESFEPVAVEKVLKKVLSGHSLEPWYQALHEMVMMVASLPLISDNEAIFLKDLSSSKLQTEVEFYMKKTEEPSHRIKGFIDLFFSYKDRFYIIDWKSNWLGPSDEFYTLSFLKDAMKEHDYYLQGSLYAEAMQRYVRETFPKNCSWHFGGLFYIFLRGIHEPNHHGIYHFTPEKQGET